MKKRLLIILIWLWLTMLMLAFFAGRSPFWQFLNLESMLRLAVTSKLLFILAVFPLMAGTFQSEPEKPRTIYGHLLECLKIFAVFILLWLPLEIAGLWLNPGALTELVRLNLLISLAAAFIAILGFRLTGTEMIYYYPAGFLIFGAGPVTYYLILEFNQSAWTWLIRINPFWLSWNIENPSAFNQAWPLQSLIWAGLIILALAIKTKPLDEETP